MEQNLETMLTTNNLTMVRNGDYCKGYGGGSWVLLGAPGCSLGPIYHKDTVQIKFDQEDEKLDFTMVARLYTVGFNEKCKYVWDTFDNLIDWENKTGQDFHMNNGFDSNVYFFSTNINSI